MSKHQNSKNPRELPRRVTRHSPKKRKAHYRSHVGVARREKLIASALIAALSSRRERGNSTIVSSEVDCFQGVADVVAGIRNGYRLFPETTIRRLRPFSFSTAKILSAIAGRKASTVEKISGVTGLSLPTVRKQLSLLRKFRILTVKKGGQVSIIREIRLPFKEITAFEVKVKDWRSGIYQARNYKSFAHKVSVVLPMKRAKLLSNRLNEFRRMRVGLLGVTAEGKIVWLLRPRRERPISGPRNFLAAVKLLQQAA